jgi:hypothetical protein
MNQRELNNEMLNYLLSKIIKKNKKNLKDVDKDELKEKALSLMSDDKFPLIKCLHKICKYVDWECKGLKGQYKRGRVIDYYKFLVCELQPENKNKLTDDQLSDIVDLLIDSSRYKFNCNINKRNMIKDLSKTLGNLVALMIPFVKFFR